MNERPKADYYVPVADANEAVVFLNERRASEDWNQVELAEVIGTTQSAISDMFKGSSDPRFSTVSKLANALGYRLALVPFTADDHYLAEKATEL